MLFFIFVIVTVLLLTAYFIIDKNAVEGPWRGGKDNRTKFQKFCYKLRFSEPMEIFYGVALGVFLIGLIASIVFLGINYFGASSYKASLLEEQRILTYQIENKLYENDIEYGKNELFRDIKEFNTSIQKHKELTKDFWIGIYEPNIYDDIPLVELPVVEAS